MEFILVCSVSVLSLLVSAVYLYRTTWGRRPLQQLPPAPPGWPVIGHLHLLSDMPHKAMAELAKAMRAPLLRLQLGTVRAVVISKPDLARAALTTNDAALASRPHLLGGHFLAFGSSDVTFAPAGPYHRTVRRVVVSELLSARRVATYQRIRVNEVRRLLGHLAKNASVPDAPPVDLSECVLNLANDVLFRVAFGRGFLHDKAAKLGEVFAVANDFFAGFTTADFFPELEPVVSTITGLRRRLKNCFADLCEFCDEIIDELISGKRDLSSGYGGDEDFIDALLRVQKSQDMEVPLTDENIKALVLVCHLCPDSRDSIIFERRKMLIDRSPWFAGHIRSRLRHVVRRTGVGDDRAAPAPARPEEGAGRDTSRHRRQGLRGGVGRR